MSTVKSILLALVMLAPSMAFASSEAFSCAPKSEFSEKAGKEILQKTQDAYSKLKSLQARFSQESYLSSLEISEMSSGIMWFSKPGLMKWHYSSPDEQDFIVRDKTYWLYQVNEKQVVIDNFAQILISDLPIAFVLGLGNLSNDFTLLKSCQSATGEGILLELSPKSKGKGSDGQLKGFSLIVGKTDSLPRGSQVTDVAGNVTRMIFSGVEQDKTIDSRIFATNFPDGIDINDRRSERSGV